MPASGGDESDHLAGLPIRIEPEDLEVEAAKERPDAVLVTVS